VNTFLTRFGAGSVPRAELENRNQVKEAVSTGGNP
jgi:hypothetical protein